MVVALLAMKMMLTPIVVSKSYSYGFGSPASLTFD
jgi:hypothetical protein